MEKTHMSHNSQEFQGIRKIWEVGIIKWTQEFAGIHVSRSLYRSVFIKYYGWVTVSSALQFAYDVLNFKRINSMYGWMPADHYTAGC